MVAPQLQNKIFVGDPLKIGNQSLSIHVYITFMDAVVLLDCSFCDLTCKVSLSLLTRSITTSIGEHRPV